MTAPIGGFVEAQKVAIAFQAALIQIGIKSIAAALKLWRSVPPNRVAEVADEWLDDAVGQVMADRETTRDLAIAYYRLHRALSTGATIPAPGLPLPKTVTINELREEFARLVEDVGDVEYKPSRSDKISVPQSTVIPIERIDGISRSGDKEQARIDANAEEEARIVLAALGTRSLQRQVSTINTDAPAKDVDEKRDKAHKKAGARQAAATDRLVLNGGREVVKSLADRDKRPIGYVRVSSTGTPCGWCAMLISRGLIFYKSQATAEGKTSDAPTVQSGDAQVGDQYHDNCKCYAEPVYSEKQYKKDPRFDLNREYSKLWPKVTKGLSGKDALSAWRKYFRTHMQPGDADTGDVQAA